MFCPQCGQERTSEATSFCSRCGFLLTFTSQLLHTGGTPLQGNPQFPGNPQSAIRNPQFDGPQSPGTPHSALHTPHLTGPQSQQTGMQWTSPRARGLKRGLFMFLLMFVVAPVVGIISAMGFGIRPWPMGIVVFVLGLGGLLRMVYALLFESGAQTLLPEEGFIPHSMMPQSSATKLLDPADPQFSTVNAPFQAPAGNWRDTRDLEPHSVTETTTRQLNKDK